MTDQTTPNVVVRKDAPAQLYGASTIMLEATNPTANPAKSTADLLVNAELIRPRKFRWRVAPDPGPAVRA